MNNDDDLHSLETFMPDDLAPLYRLRKQLDIAIQLAESGNMKKMSPEDLEERRKHPEIIGEIGDFEIRWRGNKGFSAGIELQLWRIAALYALSWMDTDLKRARTVLRERLKAK